MERLSDRLRIWLPLIGLLLFGAYTSTSLILAHVDNDVQGIHYGFERELKANRGSVYDVNGAALVQSVPVWNYHFDPSELTNAELRVFRGKKARTPAQVVNTIADALSLDRAKVAAMAKHPEKRYQPLGMSSDVDAHAILKDGNYVAGVIIEDTQVRQYIGGRSMCHVLGSVNANFDGVAGIEQSCAKWLVGTPGRIRGIWDVHHRELYDRREISIDPVQGASVYLTIDRNLQYEVEKELAAGVKEFGAASGWCIMMDAKTGAILAMASVPDFDPRRFGRAPDDAKINRAIAFNYEPGSVMKVITVANAIERGFIKPDSRYNTDQNDPRYYKLPGDKGHNWDKFMTITDSIVHSSNIVVGKLGYDLGPRRVYEGMRNFGFGEKTGIELPGEETGLLFDPAKRPWDKATWSRAAIGQAFSVTAIQLVSAYQAIANDGVRMKPYLIDRVVADDGMTLLKNEPKRLKRVISEATARTMREMMRGVAAPGGTARRAAMKGYSVAGKTGTAQKSAEGKRGYLPGQYRGSFCGMVPASDPRIVVLVTLDFDRRNYPYHQGGMSSGPIFRRIATKAMRYLMIPKDLAEDDFVDIFDDDEYDPQPIDESAGAAD